MVDNVIPGFHRRRANGEIFVNPMSRTEVTRICSDDQSVIRAPKNWVTGQAYTIITHSNGPWTYPALFSTQQTLTRRTNLEDIAITQAFGNVAKPDAMSLVSLAELGKTRELITHSLNSLYNGAIAIASGKSRQVIEKAFRGNSRNLVSNENLSGKVLNTLSQKWLEYRYGWMPLYFDIRDHVIALSKTRPKRRTARGYANHSEDVAVNTDHFALGLFDVTLRRQRSLEWKVRASILYEESDDIRQTINKYGLLAAPSVIWELVPFSFVADWFVNLSDCMKALSPSLGVKYLACSLSYNQSETCITYCDNVVHNAYDVLSGDFGTEVRTWREKGRDGFEPRISPRITVHMNWKRALDSLALVNGVFGNLRASII